MAKLGGLLPCSLLPLFLFLFLVFFLYSTWFLPLFSRSSFHFLHLLFSPTQIFPASILSQPFPSLSLSLSRGNLLASSHMIASAMGHDGPGWAFKMGEWQMALQHFAIFILSKQLNCTISTPKLPCHGGNPHLPCPTYGSDLRFDLQTWGLYLVFLICQPNLHIQNVKFASIINLLVSLI